VEAQLYISLCGVGALSAIQRPRVLKWCRQVGGVVSSDFFHPALFFSSFQDVIKRLDLHDDLASKGFQSFKLRHAGRYDMEIKVRVGSQYEHTNGAVLCSLRLGLFRPGFSFRCYLGEGAAVCHEQFTPGRAYDVVIESSSGFQDFDRPSFSFLRGDAPWLPLVKGILGEDARLCNTGVMLSLPGSAVQPWHSDGDHLSKRAHLSPYCVRWLQRTISPTTVPEEATLVQSAVLVC